MKNIGVLGISVKLSIGKQILKAPTIFIFCFNKLIKDAKMTV